MEAAQVCKSQEPSGQVAVRPLKPGHPPRLDGKDKRRLEEALLKGAKAAGFPTNRWTYHRVAQLILDRFGLRYHVDHIGHLLHALGWSPQKPQRRAAERDEDQIRRWVKEEWPRLKKRRAAEDGPGVHRRIRLPHGALCPARIGAQRVDAAFISMRTLAPEGVGDRRFVHSCRAQHRPMLFPSAPDSQHQRRAGSLVPAPTFQATQGPALLRDLGPVARPPGEGGSGVSVPPSCRGLRLPSGIRSRTQSSEIRLEPSQNQSHGERSAPGSEKPVGDGAPSCPIAPTEGRVIAFLHQPQSSLFTLPLEHYLRRYQ